MTDRMLRLSHYNYHLPSNLIAQHPPRSRTDARLLNLTERDEKDTYVRELPQLLKKGDLLVLNNTKVLPLRFSATKETGGKVDMLISRILNKHEAEVLLRSSRSVPIPSRIFLRNRHNKTLALCVIERKDALYLVKAETNLMDLCHLYGQMPLPPYIARPVQPRDKTRYQTVFAKKEGAAAAPTAGFHFNQPLLKKVRSNGIRTLEITLHIGAATFTPIRVNDISQHKMHSEWCHISSTAARALNLAKAQNRRIIAVGTTSLRALETAYKQQFQAYEGETSLFIHPAGPPIRAADLLLTNFHLPRSSLLLLVCAFAGYDRIMRAYAHAVKKKYRFFSYGDAMLLTRKTD